MALTYGFYDSLNHDRTYDTLQLSSIFDGLINDGVYQNIGTAFVVKPFGGSNVHVGSGRAWFNHTWTYNDSTITIAMPESDLVLDRFDAIVHEVNRTNEVRANSIKYVKGTPSSRPKRPSMIKKADVYQTPFAYIYRKAGSSQINKEDISNIVGTTECPFVSSVLGTITIDRYVDQWEAEFESWFNKIKGHLTTDAAGNLQLQIDNINSKLATYLPSEKANNFLRVVSFENGTLTLTKGPNP